MNDPRRFARLRGGDRSAGPGFSVVPSDGMCLSAYLVVRPPSDERKVLLGRLDPSAEWLEVGGLTPDRVRSIGDRWMLPSCHLLLLESPDDAARRIAREQLASELPRVEGLSVHSEGYRRPGETEGDPHWDLQFVYRVRWSSDRPPVAPVWRELAFRDLDRLPREEIARAQGDVLDLVGLSPGAGRGRA